MDTFIISLILQEVKCPKVDKPGADFLFQSVATLFHFPACQAGFTSMGGNHWQ